ncbi:hypothetical protein [Acinetobacter gerneri]|uniref:Uncharacterized protein n=1 Tax=Acinetobacter gerneri DSM 14967 = CIP 107464 = MTCC 9824 TaxID=1120926 RepID=N8YAT7_9GAMM|nr:hypothetical protein [Acinetobacter gerneri]ENV33897.1 hypothetical protein F960_01903 [Acinetobacter gerneri DSM 14967 = CIP 107464 = MTCC 9824]EPR82772.1 hypothetical protein L289_2690 [Acinetobacter gerneri DSM 14967 = CIP 107464 = MTCC 9824]
MMGFISDIKYLLVLLSSILLTACSVGSFDIIGTPKSSVYLTNKQGYKVFDCQGQALVKDWPDTDYFWKENNLPKGTTEFTCVDGKAYVKGKEPK